ncbi:MAG: response regulator [Phycisphaerales bacterium]|nr:response regulator [Phycisphaerales bacterium]
MGAAPTEPDPPWRVLVLQSYDPEYRWTDAILAGVRSVLAGPGVELHVEYLDTHHRDDSAYLDRLVELLVLKHAGDPPFDVVLACDDAAFALAVDRRPDLAPDAPIVFCGLNEYPNPRLAGLPAVTGVVERTDLRRTIDLALGQRPGVQRIVAAGSRQGPTGAALFAQLERLKVEYGDRLDLSSLADVSREQLLERVAALGPECALLLYYHVPDRRGQIPRLEQTIRVLASRCPVPVYACWDFAVDLGAFGGRVVSGYEQGRKAAAMVRELLAGTPADSIPVLEESPNVYMFNYRELARFGVTRGMLPAGSVVLHEPESFYRAHWEWFAVLTVGLLVQAALIVILVLSRASLRRTERALRAADERLDMALRGSNLSLWDWELSTDRITQNVGWTDMLGYEPDEIPPTREALEALCHPEDLARTQAAIDAHMRGTTPMFESEQRIRTKYGEWRWVLLRGRVVQRGPDGRPLRISGTRLDISEQKATQEQRRRLEAQMQHAQKLESIGVLAGGIAHDFNNLLVGVLGHAELARDLLPENAPARENLLQIERSAARAAELTRQLLAYSGRGKFVVERVDLNELVAEMLRLLEVSISKKAALVCSLSPGLPPVEADTTQLRQLVMNLITNAGEALPDGEGRITLSTFCRRCDEAFLRATYVDDSLPPGEYVCFEVTDTGCGMDEDTRARIFEPFFTTKFTGRGLGLAAALGIIRGHRGALEVISAPGAGSTFRVWLPAALAPPREQRPAPPVVPVMRGSGRILLADDDDAARSVCRAMLERMGFDVLEAIDGVAALDLLKQRNGDVRCVLLDLTMPRLDGIETLRELRRRGVRAPVVLLSGYDERDVAQRYADAGLAGFLHKPYRAAELAALIECVLATSGEV